MLQYYTTHQLIYCRSVNLKKCKNNCNNQTHVHKLNVLTTALMYFFRGHKIIEMNTSLMAMFPPRVV